MKLWPQRLLRAVRRALLLNLQRTLQQTCHLRVQPLIQLQVFPRLLFLTESTNALPSFFVHPWVSAPTSKPTQICSEGSIGKGGDDCNLCVPGRYQSHQVAIRILLLPAHGRSFSLNPLCRLQTLLPASQGQSSCLLCDAGKYQIIEGQSSCVSCAAGKFQLGRGMAICDLCSPGKYQDEIEKGDCKYCPAGYKCPAAGTSSPLFCVSKKWPQLVLPLRFDKQPTFPNWSFLR